MFRQFHVQNYFCRVNYTWDFVWRGNETVEKEEDTDKTVISVMNSVHTKQRKNKAGESRSKTGFCSVIGTA